MQYPQCSPKQIARQEIARTLVIWSHILGWGGLAALIILPFLVMVATHGERGWPIAVAAGASVVSMIVGATLGQVGRAMQGRVI